METKFKVGDEGYLLARTGILPSPILNIKTLNIKVGDRDFLDYLYITSYGEFTSAQLFTKQELLKMIEEL